LFERDAVSPAQRLEQAAGQAGHAAGEFEFEQLRLQLGGAEAGACAQCIQPHGVVAHAAQQPVFRHGIDVFGSRVRSGENGGVFQPQLFEHVAHRLDQLRSLADQGMAAARLGRVDRAGNGEHFLALLGREPGGDQRADCSAASTTCRARGRR
jgi:hypothetical protein